MSPERAYRGAAGLVVAVALSMIIEGCGGPAPDAGQESVPIVVYLVDTLRADRLGIYGYTARDTSPNLDALAEDSVVFEAAYAPAPWTLPSVASILTSTFACEHGVLDGHRKLSPSINTLAEQLAKAGYLTGAYYSNLWAGQKWDLDRGYSISEYRRHERLGQFFGDTDWPQDTAGFLDRAGRNPFLLYIHTIEPHEPWSAPGEYLAHFGHVGIDKRTEIVQGVSDFSKAIWGDWMAERAVGSEDGTAEAGQALGELRPMLASINQIYDSGVYWADVNVGAVIEVLKARGVWDKAIFVFLSDHGEEIFEHDSWGHVQSVYEELMRVPLIIHFPGGEHGGRRISEPVSLVDVMPTLLDYAGRPDLCSGCRGFSLRRFLEEPAGGRESGGPVFGVRINETTYYEPWKEARGETNVMARDGKWKFIWNEDLATRELYDLLADPGEQSDISARHPRDTEALAETARAWLADCRDALAVPVEIETLDADTRDRLRGLGYLE